MKNSRNQNTEPTSTSGNSTAQDRAAATDAWVEERTRLAEGRRRR